MVINETHINEAENIFIKGKKFDKERLEFIKHFETCDLLAVPGSGKTTALMAKLYCLSKQLPFQDGSGILVLAHTNAAVDEIERKLKKHCPNLFEYPNFIGTIQSFVNKFLANPANFIKYGSYLSKVDDEIANKRIVYKIKKLEFRNPIKTYLFHQIYGQNSTLSQKELIEKHLISEVKSKEYIKVLKDNKILTKNGFVYDKIKNETALSNLNLENELKLIVRGVHLKAKEIVDIEKEERGTFYKLDFIESKFIYGNSSLGFESNSGRELMKICEEQFKEGIVRYKDCYSLGFWFLNQYSQIKKHLQHRFKYIFIDEMQDLGKFQIDIIDKIFFSETSKSIIQRIGDINQAIYNSDKKVRVECDWKTREAEYPQKFTDKYFTGSNRLTKTNSELVNCFTLDSKNGKFEVIGNKELGREDIKPHLILFNNGTKDKLKDNFEKIIKENNLHNIEEAKFKIIGWTGEREKEGDGNLCLHSIFGYKKEVKNKNEDFDSLSKHVQLFNHEKNTLEAVRKSILNALITVLKHENKKIKKEIRGKEVERFYTKSEMIDFIREYKKGEEYQVAYENFKINLFGWCFELVTKNDYKTVFNSIKAYIENEFKEWFGLSLSNQESKDFIGNDFVPIVIPSTKQSRAEDKEKLNIEIATVHSVKGQTHCATMYVETSYHNYETQKPKIVETLKKQKHGFIVGQKKNKSEVDARGKEALKMMYVGFSRPTHLLCFAALEDNIKEDIENFRKAGWEINVLSKNN
jgi:DNA helicase-2/ATP-dependent DNA helicase PcrA